MSDVKKCPKRPFITRETDGVGKVFTTVDGFGECIGSDCAWWRTTKPMMGEGMNGYCGKVGPGNDFPNPAKEKDGD